MTATSPPGTSTATSTRGTFVTAIGFTPASWMSASICSFTVAAVATVLVGGLTALTRSRGRPAPGGEPSGTAA